MKLGQVTSTGDVEGEVVCEKPVPNIEKATLDQVIKGFVGDIQQVPPMYSALKHEGQRLYKIARAGGVVERPAREVTIKTLTLLSQTAESLSFEVCCTKGTYVRTLAEDIGEALGTGAHVTFLRRIKTGPFELSQSITIEQLESIEGGITSFDLLLHDLGWALLNYPVVVCTDEEKKNLCFGRPIHKEGLQKHDLIRINDAEGKIFGLGKWEEGSNLIPVRIFE